MSNALVTAPDTMKAAALEGFGGTDRLSLRTLPVPRLDPGEVLIRVHTAGVGVWDPWEREGRMAEMMDREPTFPYILGSDGSGTVVATGPGVEGFRAGDPVYAASFLSVKSGFYAEYAVAAAETTALLPDGLDLRQAGALASDGVTALRGLRAHLGVEGGVKLAVFGASGGLGHLAVQLAKRMGADVLAVASGADGVELVRELGADRVVDGKADGVDSALEAALADFAPDGLHAALVTVNGSGLATLLSAVREGGHVAWPNGVEPLPEPPSHVEAASYDGVPDRETLDDLSRLIAAGPFRVHIARTFPLSDAAQAHRALDEHYLGKLALAVEEG